MIGVYPQVRTKLFLQAPSFNVSHQKLDVTYQFLAPLNKIFLQAPSFNVSHQKLDVIYQFLFLSRGLLQAHSSQRLSLKTGLESSSHCFFDHLSKTHAIDDSVDGDI